MRGRRFVPARWESLPRPRCVVLGPRDLPPETVEFVQGRWELVPATCEQHPASAKLAVAGWRLLRGRVEVRWARRELARTARRKPQGLSFVARPESPEGTLLVASETEALEGPLDFVSQVEIGATQRRARRPGVARSLRMPLKPRRHVAPNPTDHCVAARRKDDLDVAGTAQLQRAHRLDSVGGTW